MKHLTPRQRVMFAKMATVDLNGACNHFDVDVVHIVVVSKGGYIEAEDTYHGWQCRRDFGPDDCCQGVIFGNAGYVQEIADSLGNMV